MLQAKLRKLLQVGLVLLGEKVYDIELLLLPAVYLSLVHAVPQHCVADTRHLRSSSEVSLLQVIFGGITIS